MEARIEQLTRAGQTAHEVAMRPLNIRDEFYVVNLYEEEKGRAFDGLGGAVTESAAHVFYQMPADKQEQLLDFYFGGGADYRYLRVSIDSCDFSIGHYEAMSDPTDKELASFSLAHDEQEIIPFIKRAEAKAGRKLPLLLSPWSPPAFMKRGCLKIHFHHEERRGISTIWSVFHAYYFILLDCIGNSFLF